MPLQVPSTASMANTDSNSSVTSVHQQSGTSNIDLSKLTALHAVFGFIIGLLILLVGQKYSGSGTTPFITHWWTMLLFISTSFVYTMAVLAEITIGGASNTSKLFWYTYLVSGSLACQLLGFILVGPFGLLLMNPSAFLLLELLRRFNLLMKPFTGTQEVTTTITEDLEVGEIQMTVQSSESSK